MAVTTGSVGVLVQKGAEESLQRGLQGKRFARNPMLKYTLADEW